MTVERAASTARPWTWRIALNHGFWDRDGLPTFHAHGPDDLALCAAGFGLTATAEPPNEGSHFCRDCLAITSAKGDDRPCPAKTEDQ